MINSVLEENFDRQCGPINTDFFGGENTVFPSREIFLTIIFDRRTLDLQVFEEVSFERHAP